VRPALRIGARARLHKGVTPLRRRDQGRNWIEKFTNLVASAERRHPLVERLFTVRTRLHKGVTPLRRRDQVRNWIEKFTDLVASAERRHPLEDDATDRVVPSGQFEV